MERREGDNYIPVSIPASLFDKIKERVAGTEFSSVSEYITFVLRQVLAEAESDQSPFTKEEREKIKERLRALGYLD